MSKFKDNRIFVLNNPNSPRLCPELAKEIGLLESILLLQLEFWISISDNERDGRKWTYQSLRDMEVFFAGVFSYSTISRAVKSLQTQQLIILGNYNRRSSDKTQWFALNLEEISKLQSIKVLQNETTCVNLKQLGVAKRDKVLQDETSLLQDETSLLQNETALPETTQRLQEIHTEKKRVCDFFIPSEIMNKLRKFYPRVEVPAVFNKVVSGEIRSQSDLELFNKAIREYSLTDEVQRGAIMGIGKFMQVWREYGRRAA